MLTLWFSIFSREYSSVPHGNSSCGEDDVEATKAAERFGSMSNTIRTSCHGFAVRLSVLIYHTVKPILFDGQCAPSCFQALVSIARRLVGSLFRAQFSAFSLKSCECPIAFLREDVGSSGSRINALHRDDLAMQVNRCSGSGAWAIWGFFMRTRYLGRCASSNFGYWSGKTDCAMPRVTI